MSMIGVIRTAFDALKPPPQVKRPLMSYLDELAYHLERTGFEPSTDLEEATADLEAILTSGGSSFGVVPAPQRRGTSAGLLLDEAIDVIECADRQELRGVLRNVIRHLDADLRHVLWATPPAMEGTRDRLARVVVPELVVVA